MTPQPRLKPESLAYRPDFLEAILGQSGGMSALGQKQTFAVQNGMSALPPNADIGRRLMRNGVDVFSAATLE